MPSGELQWLRLWTDIIDDDKLGVLAFEDRWHYVAILCMKRRGILDRNDGKEMLDRRVGKKLGLGDADRDALRKRLIEVQLIDDMWQPAAWGKRQFSSDSSTYRVKAFRERSRNVDETKGNVSVTPSESESESEKNKNPLPPSGGRVADENPLALGTNPRAMAMDLDPEAWRRWFEYRREIRKPIKSASMLAAQKKLAGFGANQAQIVEQTIANGWTGIFELKGAARQVRGPRGLVV